MARITESPLATVPNLTGGKAQKIIERLRLRITDLEAFDPATVLKRWGDPAVSSLEAAIKGTLEAAFGVATSGYRRYAAAAKLDNGPLAMNLYNRPEDPKLHQGYLAEGKAKAICLLKSAVTELQEE